MGVITLYNRIVSRANSELDVLLDETDIDTIICDKNSDYSNSVIKLVKQMTAQYVEDLLGTFRERGIDLKTGCIVFIGGGSKLLKPYLPVEPKVPVPRSFHSSNVKSGISTGMITSCPILSPALIS